LSQNAGAVAGPSVCIDGSTVGEIAESFKRVRYDLVSRSSSNVRDESDSASIVLIERVVQ